MIKPLIVTAVLLLSGCASAPPEWLKTDSCRSIGCGKDLTFYPNERGGASRQARDWHGFEWGKTSSACHQKDPKCQALREKEIEQGQTPWHWNNR
jgi:hypothetical protein